MAVGGSTMMTRSSISSLIGSKSSSSSSGSGEEFLLFVLKLPDHCKIYFYVLFCKCNNKCYHSYQIQENSGSIPRNACVACET